MPRSTSCTFPGPGGHDLAARLDRPDGPVRATAVFAHCLTGSQHGTSRRLSGALADHGLAVLSLDLPGPGDDDGQSEGSASPAAVDALVAAAGHLAEVSAAPALLVGHSRGGAAALAAARRLDAVEAVATIGAPTDDEHVLHVFDDGLDVALLVLHDPLDGVVGISNAARLFQAARHPRSFVSLAGSGHLLTDEDDARYVADVVAAWATRYVGAAARPTVVPGRATASPAGMPRGTGTYEDAGAVATDHGGLQADVETRGFRLRVDEPASRGGGETGPTPYDYLASALAACTSMTVRMYADRKDLPLDAVTTTVTFDRVHADDCATCDVEDRHIELFTRTVSVEGALDDQARQRLLEIANRCPVHRTLEGTIRVRTSMVDP